MIWRAPSVVTVLLMACLSISPLTVIFAANASTDSESTSADALEISHDILVDLGILGAANQVDRVITHAVSNINHTARQRLSPDQTLQLQQSLRVASGSAFVSAQASDYFSHRLADDAQLALDKLNDDLVLRVRNFDVSLEMKGGVDKYQSFEQSLVLENIAEQRLALLERLDHALQISATATMLHIEITITAIMAAEKTAENHFDADLLISSMSSKRPLIADHMAATLLKIHLFTYRFMPDQELLRYVEILEDSAVQGLLEVGQQGLRHALQAGRDQVIRKQMLSEKSA